MRDRERLHQVTERFLVFHYDEDENQRLDHFLVSHLPEYSRSFLQNLIKDGRVTVGKQMIIKTGEKLDRGDNIEIRIPPPVPSELIPEDIPLEIIYEDNDLIIINKAAGMVVHPAVGHNRGTLVHAVLAHAPDIEGIGGERRPGLVHRLDKNTSGLIVLAKNDRTHQFLQKQFKERSVEKLYLALVDGAPPTPSGRVEASIGRDCRARQRMAVTSENKGRLAISEYKTLEKFEQHSLLQVRILTGRTHQIRVHMGYLKCPVVGDIVYGRRKPSLEVARQMLHAATLRLVLPSNPQKQEFTAPLPADFENILNQLRGMSSGEVWNS